MARLFGAEVEDFGPATREMVAGLDLGYSRLPANDRDNLILGILQRIDSPELAPSGEGRKADWEKGWSENLNEFVASGCDPAKLIPKYYKKKVPVRLDGDYAMPSGDDFVLHWTAVFRDWLFRKYLAEADAIYEFGCGPGAHLHCLASMFPDKRLYGLDWARASQEILSHLSKQHGGRIRGLHFDFFAPDPQVRLEPNSAVYTFGALEQVGDRHEPFLEFLLRQAPRVCVNVECFSELYEAGSLPDHLALKYHQKRNYLDGYLTRLRQLDATGRIELLKVHHQSFGNLYHDSHSYAVWRPKVRAGD